MSALELTFHPDFYFFLTRELHKTIPFLVPHRGASVKDIIESFGVPHTEVGRILVRTRGKLQNMGENNGASVDFDCVPRDQDRIFIYPPVPPVDVTLPTLLRPLPFKCLTFVADVNVGALARLLLSLGFDTLYSNAFSDEQVAQIAERQQRVVLTRDTGLLKRKKVIFARRVREETPEAQLKEVLTFFGKDRGPFFFLSRCLACNVPLVPVEKQAIAHLLQPLTRKYYHRFKRCPRCGGIFWKGSHVDEMAHKMMRLFPDGSFV